MARDGHDYDMGFHAPWCAKCGGLADADAAFSDEQDADFAFHLGKLQEALANASGRRFGGSRASAIEAVQVALEELEAVAGRTFEWSAPSHDYDGPDTLEEARGDV